MELIGHERKENNVAEKRKNERELLAENEELRRDIKDLCALVHYYDPCLSEDIKKIMRKYDLGELI